MLKDALDFIFAKSQESANPVPSIRSLGRRRRVVTLRGVETEEMIEPERLQRDASTLESVAALSERFGGEKLTAFVGSESVCVVLDDDDRVETVDMQFCYSPQFLTLGQLRDGVDQKTLVKTLRTKLAGVVANEDFLKIVRQVEFDVARGSRGEVSHQKESLGRSVEKQVRANAGEVPETIRVVLPLYSVPADVPTTISLDCAVTIDMDSERIAIEPTGDSLSREKSRVAAEIVDRLAGMMPEGALVVEGSVGPVDD